MAATAVARNPLKKNTTATKSTNQSTKAKGVAK
jgi:hypothetical protein